MEKKEKKIVIVQTNNEYTPIKAKLHMMMDKPSAANGRFGSLKCGSCSSKNHNLLKIFI